MIKKHITSLLSLILTCLTFTVNSQKDPNINIQPYVLLKDSTKLEFDHVRMNHIGLTVGSENFVCFNNGEKQIIKRKEVLSALMGKKGDYDPKKHSQIVLLNLELGTFIVHTGEVHDGASAYHVLMKKDSSIFLSYVVANANTPDYIKYYYLVQGNQVKKVTFLGLQNEKFIEELIVTFGACDELNEELTKYKNSKGKVLLVKKLSKKLKNIYFQNSYEE